MNDPLKWQMDDLKMMRHSHRSAAIREREIAIGAARSLERRISALLRELEYGEVEDLLEAGTVPYTGVIGQDGWTLDAALIRCLHALRIMKVAEEALDTLPGAGAPVERDAAEPVIQRYIRHPFAPMEGRPRYCKALFKGPEGEVLTCSRPEEIHQAQRPTEGEEDADAG